MARRLTTGFETGRMENSGVWVDNFASSSIATDQRRTGAYSWKAKDIQNASSAYAYINEIFADDPAELYIRFAFRFATVGSLTTTVERMVALFGSDGVAHLSLGINSVDYLPRVFVGGSGILGQSGGTEVASATVPLSGETWHVLELYAKIADSGGQFVLKVNGTTALSYTGDTKAGIGTGVRQIQFGATMGGGANVGIKTFWFDDIAVNDTAGSYENSWPGLGGVFWLYPNANGDQNDWIPSAGTANWDMVDERPPDNATTFNQGYGPGSRDLYQILDCPEYVAQVNLVQVAYRAALATSGYTELTDIIKTGGTVYSGIEQTIVPITPSFTYYLGTPHYLNPQTGSAWGTAQINALQVGIEITTS